MKIWFSLVSVLFFIISSIGYACTGITVKTNKNDVLQARTVEYGEGNLNSQLVITPRGHEFQSLTPEGKINGLKWKNKYGYVGISMINEIFIGEGVNEEGLNAGIFYFPHYGKLKNYNPKDASSSLVDMEFVKWILGNFKTVDEVKEGLKNITIVSVEEKEGKQLSTGHWRVGDKNGGNIVIEIVENGQVKIYDNKVGVLTNSPDYDWHIKNLNNYINLYAGNAKDYTVDGQQIFSFGAGTGMLGLPGDITPPSRFIRAFLFLKTLKTPESTLEGVLSAFHVLNNFDIPIGVEYSAEHKKYIPKGILSATQWTTVSNLTDREFYYKTMNDNQIRKVYLKKMDFNNIKYQAIPLDDGNGIKELVIK